MQNGLGPELQEQRHVHLAMLTTAATLLLCLRGEVSFPNSKVIPLPLLGSAPLQHLGVSCPLLSTHSCWFLILFPFWKSEHKPVSALRFAPGYLPLPRASVSLHHLAFFPLTIHLRSDNADFLCPFLHRVGIP